MNGFIIKGKQGYIRIELMKAHGFPNSTCHYGGYDSEGIIEIKSGNYSVSGDIWFSTGEIYEFYKQLEQCYQQLNGDAVFWNYEASCKIEIKFVKLGQIVIQGYFKETAHQANELLFEIESDQTFISSTIKEIKKFVDHYGDLKGIK